MMLPALFASATLSAGNMNHAARIVLTPPHRRRQYPTGSSACPIQHHIFRKEPE